LILLVTVDLFPVGVSYWGLDLQALEVVERLGVPPRGGESSGEESSRKLLGLGLLASCLFLTAGVRLEEPPTS
jgi:hypothetical protein